MRRRTALAAGIGAVLVAAGALTGCASSEVTNAAAGASAPTPSASDSSPRATPAASSPQTATPPRSASAQPVTLPRTVGDYTGSSPEKGDTTVFYSKTQGTSAKGYIAVLDPQSKDADRMILQMDHVKKFGDASCGTLSSREAATPSAASAPSGSGAACVTSMDQGLLLVTGSGSVEDAGAFTVQLLKVLR